MPCQPWPQNERQLLDGWLTPGLSLPELLGQSGLCLDSLLDWLHAPRTRGKLAQIRLAVAANWSPPPEACRAHSTGWLRAISQAICSRCSPRAPWSV